MADYPSSITTLSTSLANATTSNNTHPAHHNAAAAEIIALETELGLLPKGGSASVAARLTAIEASITALNAAALSGATAAYTVTNVTTDRTYDANSFTMDEIADVLGTLIADLIARDVLN